MQELLSLFELGTQVLQKQGEEEATMCMALIPPLVGVAALGLRDLLLRWRAARPSPTRQVLAPRVITRD